MTIYFSTYSCDLGMLLVAANQTGLCAIFLGDNAEILISELSKKYPNAMLTKDEEKLAPLGAKLVDFVQAPQSTLDLPLDIQGTTFQRQVWQAIMAIPVGKTISYTDIANDLGLPKAVRAVANACAANMLAIVIPCHRVVRHDGAISGYRWGVARKRTLLDREASISA